MNQSLSSLTDAELCRSLERYVAAEGENTQQVIRHLEEVQRRRLYAELGFSSLFDYATRGLGYSKSSAWRRIKIAEAGANSPKVYEYLREGTVSLSTIESCAELLKGKESTEVLESLRGKTKEEVRLLAAASRAIAETRDRIEPIVCSVSQDQGSLFDEAEGNRSYSRRGSNYEVSEKSLNKFRVSFTACAEFMEDLKRARELNFTGLKEELLLENVLWEGLKLYLEKHCPKKRLERRRAKETKVRTVNPRSRRVPTWLRDEVLERDGQQCTYVGTTGIRCGCRLNLEIDHRVPFARGGETRFENLRTVCAAHNLQAEIEVFGREFVEEKIGT